MKVNVDCVFISFVSKKKNRLEIESYAPTPSIDSKVAFSSMLVNAWNWKGWVAPSACSANCLAMVRQPTCGTRLRQPRP